MPTTNFSRTWGGKIFPDHFGTVRLSNPDKYFVGDVHEIVLDGVNMGTAKINAVRVFTFQGIRDDLSFLDAGMSASKFAGMLTNMYKEKVKGGVKPSTEFVRVVYQWQHRNFHAHTEYMSQFFEKLRRDHKDALFNP